jgi:single-strand DNA-binding protein
MNVVVLIGRLVADPELKYTPSGTAVATFRIAVDRMRKSESGEKEADFIDIVAWTHSAEFAANYLSKGSQVAIEGRIQARSWVQQDGQKRWKTEVVANRVEAVGPRRDSSGREPNAPHPAEYDAAGAPAGAPASAGPADSDMDYDPFAEE